LDNCKAAQQPLIEDGRLEASKMLLKVKKRLTEFIETAAVS